MGTITCKQEQGGEQFFHVLVLISIKVKRIWGYFPIIDGSLWDFPTAASHEEFIRDVIHFLTYAILKPGCEAHQNVMRMKYNPFQAVGGKPFQLFQMVLDMDLLQEYNVYRLAPLQPMKQVNDYIRFVHRRKRIYYDRAA